MDSESLSIIGEVVSEELQIRDARIKALEERVPAGADDVAEKLLNTPAFIEIVRGKDGEAPATEEVVKALLLDESFIKAFTPKPVDVDAVVKTLLANDDFCKWILPETIFGKQWEPGVYREASVVCHNFGQYFRAKADTVVPPSIESADWERVGTAGLRMTGPYNKDAVYHDGDLFVKDYGLFMHVKGEPQLIVGRGPKGLKGPQGEPGKDGADGKDGKDGDIILSMETDGTRIKQLVERADGTLESFSVDLTPMLEATAAVSRQLTEEGLDKIPGIAKDLFYDLMLSHNKDPDAVPLRFFRGLWYPDVSFERGDCAVFGYYLVLCIEANQGQIPDATPSDPTNSQKYWRVIGNFGGGGGGGDGGGVSTLSRLIIDGSLDMGGFGVQNVRDPRTGVVGKQDAVNRDTMEKAIAAGALYQGIYTVATNSPDISSKADAGFTAPTAGSNVNAPLNSPAITDPTNNIQVWFDLSGSIFHLATFPHTLNAPHKISIGLSNGHIIEVALLPQTYQSWVDVANDIHDKLVQTAPEIASVHWKSGADLWMGLETVAPLYAVSVSDQADSPFPAATPGAGNTILNTYNWVVQTQDENTPEALPPGIPGLAAGTVVKNSDVLQWSSAINGFEVISGSSLTQSFSDQRYWQVNGSNMAWVDQSYNRGAIVYHAQRNAWFTAMQSIPVGSPEPGDVAAGAIWRKINSTYGATVFFGTGDYDLTDTTAANNWGMPTGTYPSGQQPLNGDSYFDVITGSITDFAVTEHPPSFSIDEVMTLDTGDTNTFLGTMTDVATPGASAMEGFSKDGIGLGLQKGAFYRYAPTAQFTPTSGYFAGSTFGVGTFYIVWTGDDGAGYSGWGLVDTAVGSQGNNQYQVSIPTTTPQVQPDTIVGHITYGFARNFHVTLPANAAEDSIWSVIEFIEEKSQILRVEMRQPADDGAVFEFELLISGQQVVMVPVAAVSQNSYIKEIQAHHRSDNNIILLVKVAAAAAGQDLEIRVESADGYLTKLKPNVTTAAIDTAQPTMNGLKDYPSPEAAKAELIAQSTSADIQVPQWFSRSSRVTDASQVAFSLGISPTRYLKIVCTAELKADIGSWPQIIGQLGGSWIDWSVGVQSMDYQWVDNGGSTGVEFDKQAALAFNNSGLHLINTGLKGGQITTLVAEFFMMGDHTVIKYEYNYESQAGKHVFLKGTANYHRDFRTMNYIGYKVGGGTAHNYINAYIMWE